MRHERDIRPVQLPARALHRIQDGKGLQVTVVSGVVWITLANDNRDVILSRGQSFIIDREGLTVVFAIREAAILVGPAGHVSAADFRVPGTETRAAGSL